MIPVLKSQDNDHPILDGNDPDYDGGETGPIILDGKMLVPASDLMLFGTGPAGEQPMADTDIELAVLSLTSGAIGIYCNLTAACARENGKALSDLANKIEANAARKAAAALDKAEAARKANG